MVYDGEEYLDANNGLVKLPRPLRECAKISLNEVVNGLSNTVTFIFVVTLRLHNLIATMQFAPTEAPNPLKSHMIIIITRQQCKAYNQL